jgi:hypothetical protein
MAIEIKVDMAIARDPRLIPHVPALDLFRFVVVLLLQTEFLPEVVLPVVRSHLLILPLELLIFLQKLAALDLIPTTTKVFVVKELQHLLLHPLLAATTAMEDQRPLKK